MVVCEVEGGVVGVVVVSSYGGIYEGVVGVLLVRRYGGV